MTGPTRTDWRTRFLLIGSAATLAIAVLVSASPPAKASVWFNVGVPFPGMYAPAPFYGYPAPYGYYPPPAYYPSPYGYYPAAPAAPAPTAYAPQVVAPNAMQAPAAATAAAITYTNKPAFKNAAGQTCREYKATDGGRDVLGTACQQADGQWRVTN